MLHSLPFDRKIASGSTFCESLLLLDAPSIFYSPALSLLNTSCKKPGIGYVKNLCALTSFIVVLESTVLSRQYVMNSKRQKLKLCHLKSDGSLFSDTSTLSCLNESFVS
jgi:hypothetical protein